MRRALLPVGCLLTTMLVAFSMAHAQGDAKEKKGLLQELKVPLRVDAEWRKEWKLMGLDAQKCVKFEKEGMRITLPTGVEKERPHTGLSTGLHVRGDFEITVNYEILTEPDQADTGKPATRLLLIANVAPPTVGRTVFTRGVETGEGERFSTWSTYHKKFERHTAKSKTGRLKLVRSGAKLSFWVAEPADGKFEHLREVAFSSEDLIDVKLLATTGGTKAAFDVRYSDLHVRATGLPNVQAVVLEKPVAPQFAPAPDAEAPATRGWLSAVVLIGFGLAAVLALILGVIVFFLFRKKALAPAAPVAEEEPAEAPPLDELVAVVCPDCGKNLKAKAALAGKKVKCGQCGKAVLVPTDLV